MSVLRNVRSAKVEALTMMAQNLEFFVATLKIYNYE